MLLFSFIVAFVLITLYMFFLLKWHSKALPFLILFLVYTFWCFVSIVYIDNGSYISEQRSYSHFTGASFRFVVLILPFILFAPIFFDFFVKRPSLRNMKMHLFKINDSCISTITLFISFLICGYLLLNEVISGIPLFSSEITQFNFYSTYSRLPMVGFMASTLLGYILLVCGLFFSKSKSMGKKIRYISIYLLAILYRVLMGEKFYPFILYTVIFFIPIIIENFEISYKSIITLIKKNSKLLKKLILLILILLGIVYYKYSIEESATYETPTEHLISRVFALQSHTFWGMDKYMINNSLGFDVNRTIDELKYGIGGGDILNPEYGLARIMYIVSPQSIVDMYLNKSTRFYGGYWTLALSCFGYFITPIYSVFIAFLFAFISSILYITIKNREYIMMFIAFNGYLNLFKYFNEGDFTFLLSKKMILLIILLIYYVLIKNVKYHKLSYKNKCI